MARFGLRRSLPSSPVYNSADILPALVERLEPVLRSCALEFEAVFVNDASSDSSWTVLLDLQRRHQWVRAIDLMRNCGQHNALLCGIRAARHALVVTLDDDLQNPPEEIPALLNALDDDADVVYGAPLREVHGLWRDVASQITKIVLQGALSAETARMVGPFRVFRSDLRRAFDQYSGTFVNLDVLLTWGTTRFKAVRVRHDKRKSGRSNYTFWALLRHSLNMLTGFTTAPLQAASILGLAVSLLRRRPVPLRHGALCIAGLVRAGFCVSGVGHADLFRSSAAHARYHGRILGPRAFSSDAAAVLHGAAGQRGDRPEVTYRIPFNRSTRTSAELMYIREALEGGHLSGDGPFSKRCQAILERALGVPRVLLTTSCTHALEMAALLLNIRPGDEVVVPSFTFVSTVNAFVLRGARPVFVDIRPDTLNIDEHCLEAALTPRTRAIVVVHYAGVGCDMDDDRRDRRPREHPDRRGQRARPVRHDTAAATSGRSAASPRSAFTRPRTSVAAKAAHC